ncbi:CRISPR-associated DxTHG motif protein [Thermus caliditerrae]|uniref:CRISPR-associated DxTHG motif protein n=1 Tax=Thermus caliditerrae TaxID=1330700 RepID=UPI001F371F70|nr:TM1812 family CRISPR-associated protein [Thermus caliditerrae]
MKRLLISVMGKGRAAPTGGLRYETTPYRFPEGEVRTATFFGGALFRHLAAPGPAPDLMVVGTTGSTWGLLEDFAIHSEVSLPPGWDAAHREVEAAEAGQASLEAALVRWENLLAELLGVRVALVLLPDPPAPQQVAQALGERLAALGPYEEFHLDITHGYRYLGYALLGALLPLRHAWGARIQLHYGGLELRGSAPEAPVVGLEALHELIALDESLSVLAATGDFRPYFAGTAQAQEAEEAYFFLETNQQHLVKKRLSGLAEARNPWAGENVHGWVREVLSGLDGENIEDKMANRARFFWDRGQIFKALLLLFEAIVVLGVRRFGDQGQVLLYEARMDARERLEGWLWQMSPRWAAVYRELRWVRNAIAHGTQPEQAEAQRALSSPQGLVQVWKKGLGLMETLKTQLWR